MIEEYERVNWVNDETPVNETNLNKMDLGIKNNNDAIEQLQTDVSGKQETLVSGENIVTINNQSLLNSGNITIKGNDIPTITIALAQVLTTGQDSYTQAKFIRINNLTGEQETTLANEDYPVIKLDVTALYAQQIVPAPYIWVKRNTQTSINNIELIQFSCGGEEFWYENYQTDIAIKSVGCAALVYVPSLHIFDLTMTSISMPDYYKGLDISMNLGQSIQKGEGDYSLEQKGNTTNNVKGASAVGDSSVAFGIGDSYEYQVTNNMTVLVFDSSVTMSSSWQNLVAKCGNEYRRILSVDVTNKSITIDSAFTNSSETITIQIITQVALGEASMVTGFHNIATHDYQTVVGKYNDNKATSLFEVGNGVDASHKDNAFVVYQDGHATVGGMGTNPGNKTITTKEYVDGGLALKADDASVVHTAGSEIITGIKTFKTDTSGLGFAIRTDLTNIKFTASNSGPAVFNLLSGGIESFPTTGTNPMGNLKISTLGYLIMQDSYGFSYLKLPSQKGLSSNAATLVVDDDVVHKTGNVTETINGQKTFTSPLIAKGTYYDGAVELTTHTGGYGGQINFKGDGHYDSNVTLITEGYESGTDTTTYTQILQRKNGTIALTSDIPSTSNFVTTNGSGTQTITSDKQFNGNLTIFKTGGAPALKLTGDSSGWAGTTILQAGTPGGATRTITLPSINGTLLTKETADTTYAKKGFEEIVTLADNITFVSGNGASIPIAKFQDGQGNFVDGLYFFTYSYSQAFVYLSYDMLTNSYGLPIRASMPVWNSGDGNSDYPGSIRIKKDGNYIKVWVTNGSQTQLGSKLVVTRSYLI